ncbi:putative reverse transcriptase zinc-binding domain-containing protein [Medicago truncatula]|uniref:Putative reverse transcriptase zinc-binding domain-containing protein n=1 Tax=Medicago truncatula TaxID=3880 RepID=A0A396H6X3_MEDTR|nr:putative reverse transcriptase zinc-binding domain-containing protein [Medicago truncatula]
MKSLYSKASYLLLITLILTSMYSEAQQCRPSDRISGKEAPSAQCNQENDSDCWVQGQMCTTYECSPSVSTYTKAYLTLWLPDPLVGYSVRGSYHLLTSRHVPLRDHASSLIWHKQVPLKVSLFAWRLLRDRLPTKANLVQRRVLDSEASLCVLDCGMSETAQHLFLSCDAFSSFWPLVRNWLVCELDRWR